MDLINGITGTECFGDDKDTTVCRFVQSLFDVWNDQLFVFHKPVHSLSDHAQSLLQSLFEGTANGHDLSDRLHAGAQFTGYSVEFTQVPTRDLADYIIQGRLKEGTGGFGNGVLQIEQAVTQSQLGGYEGQRITGCLGSQGR